MTALNVPQRKWLRGGCYNPPRFLKGGELLPRIRRRIHLRMRLGDAAVLVDHVGDAARVLVFRRVGGAVRDADGSLRVAQEGEGELVLFGEALIGPLVIEADAEDADVLRFVLLLEVPEPGTLPRSTGGVGLRIEPEHDLLSAKIAQAHGAPLVVDSFEFRSRIARLQHLRFPPQQCAQNASERHGAIVER